MYTEAELRAARKAALQGDTSLAHQVFSKNREAFKAATLKISKRYRCQLDDADIDDLTAHAMEAAWKAIINFRFFCPVCKRKHGTYGEVLGWSAETEEELVDHIRLNHPEVDTLPGVSMYRRVYYMTGSVLQKAIRKLTNQRARMGVSIDDCREESDHWDCANAIHRKRHIDSTLEQLTPTQRLDVMSLMRGYITKKDFEKLNGKVAKSFIKSRKFAWWQKEVDRVCS